MPNAAPGAAPAAQARDQHALPTWSTLASSSGRAPLPAAAAAASHLARLCVRSPHPWPPRPCHAPWRAEPHNHAHARRAISACLFSKFRFRRSLARARRALLSPLAHGSPCPLCAPPPRVRPCLPPPPRPRQLPGRALLLTLRHPRLSGPCCPTTSRRDPVPVLVLRLGFSRPSSVFMFTRPALFEWVALFRVRRVSL